MYIIHARMGRALRARPRTPLRNLGDISLIRHFFFSCDDGCIMMRTYIRVYVQGERDTGILKMLLSELCAEVSILSRKKEERGRCIYNLFTFSS